MTPAAQRHVMIMASAGSGKTYALTNRFIALLAAGAAPERIVALTFTRKAAGEFFDEILRKLARAARSDDAADKLARDLGAPAFTRGEALRLLRALIDGMHRLRLGTLDSFFARIVRAYPLELGLAGDFELLQEHAAQVERHRVLRQLFARADGARAGAEAEFIEAFKRATFGAEEKQLARRLERFLDEHQETFLATRGCDGWGEPARIWPTGSDWLGEEIALADEVRALRAALGTMTDGQKVRWESFFAELEPWTPGAPLTPALEYIVKNALKSWPDICRGEAEFTVERKKFPLSSAACRALKALLTHIVGAEIRRRLETTRGIYAVLRNYDALYHDRVRRAGRLTFADVQRLLQPECGAPVLTETRTGIEDAAERRLMIDYRLDAEIDHWLLDEFQDTSAGQWSVLRNLVDEAVQDTEGRRSFFCVGDVKQAIYAWREGDPRLFRQILDQYNAGDTGVIAERQLVASWRSGPAIIACVNRVFGDAAVLADLFPGRASAWWNREWRRHETALPERSGHVALLHAAEPLARWDVVRQIIAETRPLERGLTCAVLVQRNETAANVANHLRRHGIPAVAESDLRIATDNPLGAAFLAVAQAVAHPGDSLASEHVRMTPLRAVLDVLGLATPEALTRELLGRIHAEGFQPLFAELARRLEPALAPDDAFSRSRAREFVAAAAQFDATGSRDVDEFVAFMERYAIRSPEGADVVRVMTIHKSKGLGFDVVLLPDLEGNRIDERRDGLAVFKRADRSPAWVLDLPPKLFCEQDATLAAYVEAAEADACYEKLSLLYVALTRAKRALYIVTKSAAGSKSRNFPRLLADTLGEETGEVRIGALTLAGAWAEGDPDWAERFGRAPTASAPRPPALAPLSESAWAPPLSAAVRPSGEGVVCGQAGALFDLEAAHAVAFGSEVHALLAQVEWASTADGARLGQAWRDGGFSAAAVDAAERCVASRALSFVWTRPDAPRVDLWRERAFEVVLDGVWLTGVFDRVVLEKDPAGRPLRAVVYDFKTDRVGSEADIAERVRWHREQMAGYRRAVARLSGLPLERVRAELVFVGPACAREAQ